MKWMRIIIFVITITLFFGCASQNRGMTDRRSLMMLDDYEQPRNAKFVSAKYQRSLSKKAKKYSRANKKRYNRAKRR